MPLLLQVKVRSHRGYKGDRVARLERMLKAKRKHKWICSEESMSCSKKCLRYVV